MFTAANSLKLALRNLTRSYRTFYVQLHGVCHMSACYTSCFRSYWTENV